MEQEYKGTVLIVDDDKNILASVSRMMGRVSFRVFTAESGELALELLERQQVDVVLMDINMGPNNMNGLEVLRLIKARDYSCEVIIMTALPSLERAVEAERRGAYGYLEKPFTEPEKVRMNVERASEKIHLRREADRLQLQVGASPDFSGFIGKSALMQSLYNDIRNYAYSSSRVFITGESGSGKELVAKAIHDLSRRRDKPYHTLSAGNLDPTLSASLLFGHVKGAFTGAVSDSVGAIESANTGTLFIDEVADMPLQVQIQLLRFLNEGQFYKLGSSKIQMADVRLVCATNRDIDALVKSGAFRPELLNRLSVLKIEVPPLRDRPEDIPSLAWYFLRSWASRDNKPMREISPEAMAALQSCGWRKGNVRQLDHVIQQALVIGQGLVLKPEHLPREVFEDRVEPRQNALSGYPYVEELTRRPYKEAKKEAEVHFAHYYFSAVLQRCSGVINEAARQVDIEAPNLRKKLKEIRLDASPFRKEGSSEDEDSA